MSLFEPEEVVGLYWHRLVGGLSTQPRFPGAAVRFKDIEARLGLLYRALGGPGAIRLAEAAPVASRHRLGPLQKIGLGTEKLSLPMLDSETLRLPPVIDVFPDRADNEALYEWLAAWFAHAQAPAGRLADPLQRDILRLRAGLAATRATLSRWPGLRALHERLRQRTLILRPDRRLPGIEAEIEAVIRTLLGAPRIGSALHDAVEARVLDLCAFKAPHGYKSFLPVPLFGEVVPSEASPREGDDELPDGDAIHVDSRRRQASRRKSDQSERDDPLLLHRFETIFSIAEMINVNRKVEDDDEDGARQAADDLPELTIGSNTKRAATRLKMDLDLAPEDADGGALSGELTYPEWDWKRQMLRPDHCRVIARKASETGEDWSPTDDMQRTIRQVRRQFEALRPKRITLTAQPDGDDLDLAALVRDMADRKAGQPGTERVHLTSRAIHRDLSLAVLMDVSLSTDAWVGGQRVLDVEKAALLALTHGLEASGDEHAIFTFTSRRRHSVTVETVKGYGERLGSPVLSRITALRPGQYTRMGAAIRHVSATLVDRPHRHRLMLVLTDGKPNDIDHYEGRYGIEDTRAAIREARKAGLKVFGVTVDEEARAYFPYLFGRGAYAIVPDAAKLPQALPGIYRQVVG